MLSDRSSILKQKTVALCERSTNTEQSEKHATPQVEKASLQVTSSSAQLLEEMKHLQDENKALKEQVRTTVLIIIECKS